MLLKKRLTIKIEKMNLNETESKLIKNSKRFFRNRVKPPNEFSNVVYLFMVEKVIIGKKD